MPAWALAAIATGVVLAAVGGSAYWLWQHPSVQFANNLTAPVVVTRDGAAVLDTVAGGASATRRISRSDSLRLSWETTAAASDRTPIVNKLASSTTVPFSSSLFSPTVVAISAHDGGDAYFSPAITNETGEPLAITVNETTLCECRVPSGARRMPIGYYRLYNGTSVRATALDGRTAVFNDVEQSVNRRSGQVALRFRASDMRLP